MADKTIETAPPAIDPETGVVQHGDYPFNHRLRGEALAKAGRKTDPDGLITPDDIADARGRLDAAKAAEKAAHEADKPASTETETKGA